MFKNLFALTIFLVPFFHPSLAPDRSEDPITIAVILGGSNDPFYATLQSGIFQGVQDAYANVQLVVRSPEHLAPAVQVSIVEELAERGDIDYLLVAPSDMQKLIPVLEQLHNGGTEIITVDTFIGDSDYTSGSITFPLTYIGSDNFTSGFVACQVLAGSLPEGASIYIQHTGQGISTVDQRQAGCEAAAYAFGMEVVAVDYNADDARVAQHQTATVLKRYPDLAGIFGTNYFGAYGAGLAVQQVGLGGQVKVVAIDSTMSAVNLLQDGIITDIIAQKPFEMGYWAAVLAVAHARGYESIPKRFPIDYVLMNAENINDPAISHFIYSSMVRDPQPRLGEMTIAFVPGVERNPPDPFYVTLSKGVRAAAQTHHFRLIEQAPAHFNPEEQIPVIESITAGNDIDYLITAPTDREALIPVMQHVHNSGIPVITVDTYIGDGDYAGGSVNFPLTYIGSNNVMGGYIGCSQLAMADMLGTGAKIYIQSVRPGISTTDERAEGCLAAAEDFGLEVVAMDYSDNVVEDSTAQTIKVLSDHPDIVGIFGTNVFSAQGAGAAVREVGLGGIVEVVAFDATEFAIDLLQNGTVTQVIAQKPADMGYFAVLCAVAHARGISSIPKSWSTGYEVINMNNLIDPNVARFIYREDQ